MTPQQIEALAAKWEADSDLMASDGFYPLSVREAKDADAARKAWDEQTKAQVFGMRWCASDLRRAAAEDGSEVRS